VTLALCVLAALSNIYAWNPHLNGSTLPHNIALTISWTYFFVGFAPYLVLSTNTTSSTSGPSSSTTSPLSINDFNISPVPFTICLNGSNGFKIESLQASIQNNLNLPFHYISATIIFANYTLANGTVVTVNHQWIDKNQTFNTTHTFNLGADFKIPNGGMKIVNVEFVITAYVQEVSQPITKLVIWSSKC
jgi:hypothetical protein